MAISFNEAYYLEQKLAQLVGEPGFETAADVQAAFAASGLTAEQHYNQFGAKEGLNPSPEFNTDVYLNQKLAQLQADGEEGFETTADVLAAFQNAGLSPLEHYNQFGAFEAISPNNDFNAEFYLEQKLAQLQEAGETGFETTDDVLAAFQAAGLSPLDHYNQFGAFEALSPSNAFNTERYLADKLAQLQADEATAEEWAGQTTADLLASFQSAGLTPLEHFQQFGQDEGLVAQPVTPLLTLTADSESAESGDTLSFTFTTQQTDLSEVSYTLSGVDAADVVGGELTGTAQVVDGQAVIEVTLRADADASNVTLGLDGIDVEPVSVAVEEGATSSITVTQSQIVNAGDNDLLDKNIIPVDVGDEGTVDVTINSSNADDDLSARVLLAGDANLNVTSGSGDDEIYIDGSGNNVINAGAGADKIVLGSGNDIVVIKDGQFASGSSIEGGEGTNTVRVAGTNDLTTGELSNIQNVLLDADAVATLDEDQLAGVDSIVATAGAELSIDDGTGTDTLDLTDVLSGSLSSLTIANGVTVALSAEQIANIAEFTNNGTIVTDEAGAQLLADRDVENFEIDGGDFTLENAVTEDAAAQSDLSYTVSTDAEQAFDQLYLDGVAEDQLADDGASVEITSVATVAQAVEFEAGGLAIEGSYAVADTAANIASSLTNGSAAWLNASDISSLTITDAGSVSDITEIFKAGGSLQTAVAAAKADDSDDLVITLPEYTLADTAKNLADVATDDVVQDAQSITLTSAAKVTEAKTLLDNAADLIVGGYDLTDSAENLYGAPSAVRNGATDITVTGNASVVQAIRIDGFNNSGETSFDLKDGALQLFNAPVSLLEKAGEVTFTNGATTELTVAQATKLAPYLADDIDFVLNDSGANLTSEAGLALIGQFDSIQILPTTALTLDQVQTLVDLAPTNLQPSDVAIEDTAENLLSAIAPTETVDALGNSTVAQSADADTAEALIDNVISDASTVTATGDITIEQATQLLDTNVGNPAIGYSLADTAENLAANQTVVEGADSITLTDTATAAQAETLAGFSNADDIDYAIADSYANLAAVIEIDGNGALTTDGGNDALLAATSITLTDEAGSIAQARDIVALNAALEDAGKATLDYAIADSVGNLPTDETDADSVALLSGATSVSVTGTGAAIKAYAEATTTDGLFAQVDSYEIQVASTGLTADIAAAGTYYDNADAISVNGQISVADAKPAYDTLVTDNNADKLSFTDISDSAANLQTEDASEQAALGLADAVTVASGTPDVAALNVIDALVNGTLVIDTNVTDTVENLLGAQSLLGALGTGTFVATDAATVAEYQSLLDLVTDAELSATILNVDISDTITAVQSASPELLATLGANDITLQAGSEIALSVAQAAELTQVTGDLTDILLADGVTKATYEVVDTIENLINGMTDSSTLGNVLANATTITATGGVEVPEAYLTALETLVTDPDFDTLNSSYSISGEAATLAGGTVDAAVSNADAVTVTDAATISQIQDIQGNNAEVSFETISDSLSNLLNGDEFVSEDVAAIVAQAGSVTITDGNSVDGGISVAEAQALVDLLGSNVEVSYQLEDTPENLANAGELLANATLVDVDGDSGDSVSLSQFQSIVDGIAQADVVYDIDLRDTAENLLQATPEVIAVLNGNSDSDALLDSNETATVAQATAIKELLGDNVDLTGFDIADTAEALAAYQANTGDLDDDFASVTATTTFTLAQAAAVSGEIVDTDESVNGTALIDQVVIEDSYANLVNGNASGFDKAVQVIVDGAVNVSKAVQIADAYVSASNVNVTTKADALAGMSFDLEESLTYTIAAFEEDNAVLGAADSITVDGVGEISLYEKGGVNYLLGSADELSQYPQALLDVGYVIEDTVANYLAAADFASADAAMGYVLEDTSANVLATSVSTALSADEIQITDVIDTATLQDLQGLGINLTEVAGVTDSADNLAGLTLTAVAVITVTDAAITQAQADAIDGLGEDDVFSLADVYANLGTDADIENAQAVTVTDDISVAQAGTIYAKNANVTLSVVDDAANLNVLTVAEPTATEQAQIDALNVAESVSLSANQTVTVAQAEALSALEGFDGVYTLSDSAESLAAADLALLEGAAEVQVTSNATVAEAAILTALANIATDGNDLANVTITDSAANLSAASADLLDNVANITITDGEVSASQATALQALIANTDVGGLTLADTFTVVDTQANLVASANAAGVAGADTVEVSDVITLAQARAVIAAATTTNIDYALTGTRSQLQGATGTEADYATTVTVTDTVNAGQTSIINSIFDGGTDVVFTRVNATYDELTANSDALIGQAQTVDVTDAMTVQELEGEAGFLNVVGDKLVGGYEVADSVVNIVNAALNTEFSAAVVENASNVSLTGSATMNIAAASVITSLNFTGDYNIEDNASAVAGADVALINGADNVTVNMAAGEAETFDATVFTSNVVLDFTGETGVATVGAPGGGITTYTLANVDVVTLKGAADEAALGDSIQLDGTNTFEVVYGYRTGDGFVADESLAESMLVLFDTDKAVVIDGLPSITIEDTYVVNVTPDETNLDLDGELENGATSVTINVLTGTETAYAADYNLTGGDELHVDFTDTNDVLTLSSTSSLAGYSSVKVTNGTLDVSNVDGFSASDIEVASGIKMTAAQFANVTSINAGSLTARVDVSINSVADAELVETALSTLETNGEYLPNVGLLIDESVANDGDVITAVTNAETAAGNKANVTQQTADGSAATFTGTAAELKALLDNGAAFTTDFTAKLSGTATAAELNAIDAATSTTVNASGVTAISGAAADFNTLLGGDVTLAANFTATVSGTATVLEANAIDAETTGVVTASIAETDAATLATLVDANGNNVYTATIADASVDASELNAINDLVENLTVNATAITEDAAEIGTDGADVVAALGLVPNAAVTINGAISVASAKAIVGATSGTVTFDISDDAQTIVTNAAVAAVTGATTVTATTAQLSAVDAATLEGLANLNAASVYTINDSAQNIVDNVDTHDYTNATGITATTSVLNAADAATLEGLSSKATGTFEYTLVDAASEIDGKTFTNATNVEATVTSTADVSGMNLSAADSLVVDDGDTTAITATLSAQQADTLASSITKGANDLVEVAVASTTDVSGMNLSAVDSLVVDDGDNANAITATLSEAQLGAFVITTGADDSIIVDADAGSNDADTALVGDDGLVSQITNLATSDTIDFAGLGGTTTFTAASDTAGDVIGFETGSVADIENAASVAVDAAGEWQFDTTTAELTYFDGNGAQTITLVGVTDVSATTGGGTSLTIDGLAV